MPEGDQAAETQERNFTNLLSDARLGTKDRNRGWESSNNKKKMFSTQRDELSAFPRIFSPTYFVVQLAFLFSTIMCFNYLACHTI